MLKMSDAVEKPGKMCGKGKQLIVPRQNSSFVNYLVQLFVRATGKKKKN